MKSVFSHIKFISIAFFLTWFGFATADGRQAIDVPLLKHAGNGKLEYRPDSSGNNIPDFSYCGYKMSEQEIPAPAASLIVHNPDGDATSLLQAAIDHVSSLEPGTDGIRGVILLEPGVYRLEGRLRIEVSGVVIRGSGMNDNGTVLLAAGKERMTLIRVAGKQDRVVGPALEIADDYVPVNAMELRLTEDHGIEAGDRIMIHRPSTDAWITALGMHDFGGESDWIGWKPGERDLYWDREVREVNGDRIVLDAPITTALEKEFGGGWVASYNWEGRIENIGIENLVMRSEFNHDNMKDEQHCWMAVTFENCRDAWVRQVRFEHFAGSAVAIYETAARITIKHCISEEPVSEIGGYRRYTFFTMGQQCLFNGIYAEEGYHDFAVGFCAAGPNAFVECQSIRPFSFSGAVDSWASGTLFDIVNIDGNALSFKNRGQDAQGSGWCAANSVFWQCTASLIECFKPPSANNWAFGSWSEYAGDGYWEESNNHVYPRSLFYAQLAQRLGRPAADFSQEYMDIFTGSATSPSIEQAAEFTREAYEPAPSLRNWIMEAGKRVNIPASDENAETFVFIELQKNSEKEKFNEGFEISDGILLFNRKTLTGGRYVVPWWRGDPRPYETNQSGPAVTRYVPGRYGQGYTDNIDQVCMILKESHIARLEHNYGLWYDRRRDDHERVKRMDGEVWPPFYDLPFDRSGKGVAWDGLSKYDLTSYNTWYWDRLKEFAAVSRENGILLLHQNYFQHNILEAGAHYVDFPWRTANNINGTGFPEPPRFAGDHRIFMDEQFYDINDTVRRKLHRMYIRQCLDNFADNSNVIQSISAEYTGPLHFVQFWLDVIAEWEVETGHDAIVSLSTTKDVQDSILADPVRSAIVDIIDIRYWGYRPDGSLYAPEGGKHLAPRQHERLERPGNRGLEEAYRAVLEYREKYPDKAVIYSESSGTPVGWGVAMAGGSLPQLPSGLSEQFLEDMTTMKPVISDQEERETMILKNRRGNMVIYFNAPGRPGPDPDLIKGRKQIDWIDPVSGKTIAGIRNRRSGARTVMERPPEGPVILWLH